MKSVESHNTSGREKKERMKGRGRHCGVKSAAVHILFVLTSLNVSLVFSMLVNVITFLLYKHKYADSLNEMHFNLEILCNTSVS